MKASTKIALALDLIKEASDDITNESPAYHALKAMEDNGHLAYTELQREAIDEQAERLINYRSAHA